MNPSQIRFAQSVNGRQQQILTHGTVVQQQGGSAAPGNVVVLRQPMMTSAISNAQGGQVSGGTTVRSLVTQGSNRPIAANTASLGTNVQMYLTPQPVSILPRGGIIPNNQVTSTPAQSVVSVQPGMVSMASDGGTAVVSAAPRIISASTPAVRPAAISATPNAASNVMRTGGLSLSDDPSQIQSQVNKCHSFLSCLIRFSGDSQEKRRQLISVMQELIDAKISVVDFMQRVTDCLKSNYQLPQLRPFLEMVLPHLRREMFNGRITFEDGGLRRPPAEALQARTTQQIQQPTATPIAAVTTSQVRQLHQATAAQPAQILQSSQTSGVRPAGAMAIHASQQHFIGAQRPPGGAAAPKVLIQKIGTPRTVTTLSAPGLRPLHPRPTPTIMAMNANQHQHQHHQHQHQQHHQHPASAGSSVVVSSGPGTVTTGAGGALKRMAPRTQASATEDYEEYNDVAMMGGVNLNEESRNILPNVIGPTVSGARTCKEQLFVSPSALRMRILKHSALINTVSDEAVALLANALEERLKNVFTRLSVAIEHRTTQYRDCPLFEQDSDVKGQLKFLEEIDRAEKVRHDDEERAALIKAARSRSRNENTDHLKMKEKARLLMQKEYELEKQREANITALAAIGSRKKRKLDTDFAQLSNDTSRASGTSGVGPGGGVNKFEAGKRVVRRATMKDLVYVMEHDPNLRKSQVIWKAVFK